MRKLARRLVVHPSLDPALHIAVPEGHRLGEMCQLAGSNEGGSREGREKEKRSRGHLPSPRREVCERENTSEPESEKAAKGEGTKSARNTKSKLRLREGEPTTESK